MDIVQRLSHKGLEVNFANGIVYALNSAKALTVRPHTYIHTNKYTHIHTHT